MFKTKNLIIGCGTVFLGVAFFYCLVFASQTEDGKDIRLKTDDIRLTTIDTTKSDTYWIGVQTVPVPDIFLPHFGANGETEGLIIADRVVAGSPAEKAGVKRGDVFIKFGGKKIDSLPDLISQIGEVKGTAAELEVIRNGKTMTLTVTPVQRPEFSEIQHIQGMPQIPLHERRVPFNAFPDSIFPDGRSPQLMLRQMEELFQQLQGGDDIGGLFMPPRSIPQGFLQHGTSTGKQLSVTTQTFNGKTSIKVTQVIRDGSDTEEKIWEVDNFDELPEEIRNEVQMLFGK